MKVREVQEKLLGTKTIFFLLNFWDINNQFKKKCSLGARISGGGGGVTLIRAMPRFKVFFFMCVLPNL